VTSVVTAVRHGPVERAFVMRAGEPVLARIPVAALKDFVTERGNPHNLKGISSAEVEAPAAFLKRGLHFVDTPGVGSVHAESTAVTHAFLPSADARRTSPRSSGSRGLLLCGAAAVPANPLPASGGCPLR